MKRKSKLPRVQQIKITLLMMGSAQAERTFWDKAEARAYFSKYHDSVCCYPLVEVDGETLGNMQKARKFFGIKGDPAIPWASGTRGGGAE